MTETIIVKSIEQKLSQKTGKPYWRVQTTNQGYFNCFDEKTVEELKKHYEERVEVEIVVSGNYKHINAYVGEVIQQGKVTLPNPLVSDGKHTTMYVSYAKDIFCALRAAKEMEKASEIDVMEEAISLVKQAREAFK